MSSVPHSNIARWTSELRDGATRWGQAAGSRIRRAARPVRLVAVAILVTVAGTAYWMSVQSAREAASAVLLEAVPAAEQAIQSGDLSSAETSFARAVAALDRLRATDPVSQRVRQRHREVSVLNRLAPQTPHELLASRVADPTGFAAQFATLAAGRWVLLDVPLTFVSAGKGTSSSSPVPLDLPLQIGGVSARFEIAPAVFHHFDERVERAVLAVRYGSWTLADRAGMADVVSFESEAVLLWTSSDLLLLAGLNPAAEPDPSAAILARQAKTLGLAEPSASPETAVTATALTEPAP